MTRPKKVRKATSALSNRGSMKAPRQAPSTAEDANAATAGEKTAAGAEDVYVRATGGKILRKPVYSVKTHPVNDDSGFLEKRLCDGFTFTAGTACGYSCQYCYVEAMVFKLASTKKALKLSGRPFNEIVIRREDVLRNLVEDLTGSKRGKDQCQSAKSLIPPALAKKWGLTNEWLESRIPKYRGAEWRGKVIYGSPLVDVAATKELALETVEMCDVILRLTDFDIRLLSKSPLLATVIAKELVERFPDKKSGAKARLILGFSTGTLDDGVARAIETDTPSPSARLKALHGLQDAGFRTYGMLCPVLPQPNPAAYKAYAQAAMKAIRAERCEEIWSEVVNLRVGSKAPAQDSDEQRRRDSFKATLQALQDGGFDEQADLFKRVTGAEDPAAWEEYSRTMFEALLEAAPEQKDRRLVVGEKVKATQPKKLWWLHYPPGHTSIDEYWERQQVNGVLLLGPHAGTWRASKQKAAEDAQQRAIVVQASADSVPAIKSAVAMMADKNLKCPDEVVLGILHKGTRGVLGGVPKVGKSWAALDLAMSVATGTPWLKWPTVAGKVLYVDYELLEPVFANRMRDMQAAKVQKFENLDFANFQVMNLCGNPVPFQALVHTLVSRLKGQNYSLIIIDPLYQATGGKGENSPNAINQLCTLLGTLSKQTGAAVLLVHHFSKGKNTDKPLVDRFAGRQYLTRDAFTLIGLTKYPEPNCVKLEFELRNFPEQAAVVLERQPPTFTIRDDIDLGALEEQVDEKKKDRSKVLLDLLGTDGLTASDWEKQAQAQHKIPRATFFREKKKLVKAKKVHQDEKTKGWKKIPQS